MSALDLIACLRDLGVRLSVDGNELLVDAPHGVVNSELAEQIRERKVQIVALLKWSARSARSADLLLVPIDRSRELPLSYAQQRLWFLDQLEQGSAAYNISWTVRLNGTLNMPAMQQAVNAVVERHEVLRSSFPAADGAARVQISEQVGVPLEQSELHGATDERLRAHLSQLAASSFDLARAPLCRVFLVERSVTEHVLLVLIHHIIADGASMRILFRELALLYEAAAAGDISTGLSGLTPLDIQYPDFAAWQRDWLSGDQLEQQLDYWTNKLKGAPPVMTLPADRPRSAALRFRGASVLRAVPQRLAEDLRSLGRNNGATLFMVMFAVFDLLLNRYSGQTDLVVGTPISGRSRTALEGLIGFFVNTAVLRTHLTDEMSFRDLLRQVRDTALEAHTHQELPFEKLVEVLQPERELSHTPIFQVMFDLQEEPRWQLPVQNLEVIPEVIFSSRTSTFDLTLSIREAESGLDAMFEYDTDLFDEATIERFAKHFENLLHAVLAKPDVPLSELAMLTVDEQATLLPAPVGIPADEVQTLHGLFERALADHPESIALLNAAGDALSYKQLNQKAEQVVTALRLAGINSGARVGICAGRGSDTVAAILGVLKAGACWLPLDPDYPTERLAQMLAAAEPSVVLVHSDSAAVIPASYETLVLDKLPVMSSATQAPTIESVPTSVACVLFTSGSSGTPKAVLLQHGGLTNYVQQLARETGVTTKSKVLQFASLNFDISIEEMFVAFAGGATLVLREDGSAPSIDEFVEFCKTRHISWVSLPTAYWNEWTAELAYWDDLHTVVIGGEKVLLENWRRWQRVLGSRVQLLNTYGPTEASIAATWFELTHQNPDSWHDIPIGRPLQGAVVYILDKQRRPQPHGVPGDLYIGGVGVARGYLGRESEAFIANPFADGRLYNTGDRGRYLSDGNIEYLGRADEQIKLRGHRLEPTETAAALLEHPAVDNCVVLARAIASNTDSPVALIAWCVSSEKISSAELKQFVQSRLPDYMVPGFYVMLPSLPLTTNGKVDKQQLPDPDTQSATVGYRPAQSEPERQMVNIWVDVLGVTQVGLDDDFFALGGHSLLATRVIARIRNQFNADVPLRLLFNNPNPAALLQAMASQQQSPASQTVRRRNSTDLPPLSFAQKRLWFLDQLGPGNSAFNLPWMVRLQGDLSLPALQAALDALLNRHESLRTRFAASGGDPLQLVMPVQSLPITLHNCFGADDVRLEAELRELIARPFDLQQGPLIRADLFRVTADDHVLLLLMHHIVSDGWSMGVIYRELSVLYAHYCNTTSALPVLPELAVQYADYAIWQREWLAGNEFPKQLAYWRKQLSGMPPLLSLGADYPRPTTQSYAGAWLNLELPKTLSKELSVLAGTQGCSTFMLLLSVFKVLLARYAGSEDIVVGTPVAGRQRTELEAQVGFFLNTLVLRSDLSGNPRFSDFLTSVRQTALEAFEFQDVPFEKLVEELQPERNPAYPPLVQVMFNLHNEPHTRVSLPGLSASTFSLASGTAKFDLNVAVHERDSGMLIGMEYSTDLFTAATINGLLAAYAKLLAAVIADPLQRLTQLPLPGGVPVLAELPEISASAPALAMQLAAIVMQHGDAIACDDGALALSYRQLGGCATELAGALAEHAGPIGLVLNHDALTVAAIAAMGLLNKTWVPLDPKLPLRRLENICRDAGITAVITTAEHQLLVDQLSDASSGLQQISVSAANSAAWAACEWVSQPQCGSSNHVAYILYTSGTTGKAKGVPQTATNLQAHINCYAESLSLSASDRLSLLAAYGFDAAIMDIYAGLVTGACVCPVDLREETAPLAALLSLDVSVLHATPTVFRLLMQETAALPDVRALVLGGEEASAADFALFRKRFAEDALFVNGLGPSESTTALQFVAQPGSSIPQGVVPIGKPVSGTQVELRGNDNQPSAFCGELIIRSRRLAPGYWHDTEATEAAFIDSFTYRSGDTARYLPDGSLVFTGRCDEQIKLRGQRIETLEVEKLLSSIDGIRRSVVRLADSTSGPRLVAWIQLLPKQQNNTSGWRRVLREMLPESMVPTAFIVVDVFPLTLNGKLDIAALPLPELNDRQVYRAPLTEIAAVIAEVWGDVLEVSAVGLDDDFFALGGHSLLATRMMARLRDRLRVQIPLGELFSNPVLERFAEVVADCSQDSSLPLTVRSAEQRLLAPLSWSQQRLWFLDQLEPDSTAYTLHRATRLKGALQVQQLQRALNQLVARHESLRTVFASRHGDPVQMVLPKLCIPIHSEVLSGASDAVLEARLLDEVRQPFDLQRGPLLRAILLNVAQDDSVLLISMHHIISDGWSMGVLCDELSRLYRGTEELSPLPVQYIDYALWQLDWLAGDELERQLAYWRKQLLDVPPVLGLPYDRLRPRVPSYRGAWVQRRLSATLSQAASQLAIDNQCTLYMVLLATFSVVLSRYSGREDIVVGTPVAGRQRSELESLIGFFLNTLVMRSDLSGNPDVKVLLERVRETALGAYQHQDLPFEKLLEALQPARSLSTPPLVQVMFNLHNEFDQSLQLTDESYTFHLDRGAVKFDLNLAVTEGNAGLLLALEYSSDLFDVATIEQMLKGFESILVDMTQSHSRRLSGFSWRVDAQSVSIPAPQPLAAATTVVELFARQLSHYAARPAVQVGDRVWTYAELSARANRVAADVLAMAAGLPAQRVGLLLGHDAVMLAGLLGTLKAGKTYVPLDPESPPERLQSIIASAGVTMIVSAAEYMNLATILADNFPVIAVSDAPVSDPGSPELQPSADDLAYILFTSGTTGKPKGVMQTHANVLHHAETYRNAIGLGSGDRLSLLSPFGFDAAVMDIYAGLISGACLCPFDLKHEAYLGEVIEAIAASNITVLHATPTVYRYLMRHKICHHDVTEVRVVVLGGEAAKTGDFEFFKSNFPPHTIFVNGLGPSECSLALQWFGDQQTELHGGLVPIGKAVAGAEVILLDTQQQESGICGEIAIACTHVTPGYWQQPEITSAAFVEVNGKRWYRSGDSARYLPDGNLVFTGRIDEQIKLRGHRIEPGEIEAQLATHERTDRAVVALCDDLQGNPRLVAWVVPKKRQVLQAPELRGFLKAHLPRYMMPSVIMVLDNLPLTPNGKVDRHALPVPKWGRNEEQNYVAPRNQLEQKLTAIWSDVLGVEKIGVDDDFFELGGHSLLAMQLMARTAESLQVGLPLRRLFDGPTIAQVAKSIDDVRWALGSTDS